MRKQLKELNTNITKKNARIKKSFPTMKKVKVVFKVEYSLECGVCFSAEYSTLVEAKKSYKQVINNVQYWNYITLSRVQRGGYVGGIILGTTVETLYKNFKE
ncbi:MAG TPA: hypothetical protein PK473_03155 [Nitrosomonas sp.]|nr:hypothetical protein [Agitococcus sp.]HNA70009.1 hypothetical protein [Nitrosomonas sp.]